MKYFIVLLCHCLVVLTTQAARDQRSELTTFWGQEYIGADFVREEMKLLKTKQKLEPVDMAVFDIGFEKSFINVPHGVHVPEQKNGRRKMTAHHGTAVMNLINGPGLYGVTDMANIVSFAATVASSMYTYELHKFKQKGDFPKVISNSTGWLSPRVTQVAKEFYDRGTMWFLAAGNKYPDPVVHYEAESKAILVGSMSSYGLESYKTQRHARLKILAPGDRELVSIDGKGKHTQFGQTSGATPLVAATAVNILSVVPEMTQEQVVRLLMLSGHKSLRYQLGDRQGPKLLNSYKAFKVAQRLKEKCVLEKSHACLDRELAVPANFHFIERKVIHCAEGASDLKALKEMRRRALLTTHKKQLTELACAYQARGFYRNAFFYSYLAKGLSREEVNTMISKHLEEGRYESPFFKFMQ